MSWLSTGKGDQHTGSRALASHKPLLSRELVLRRPHEFKVRALNDIKALFPGDLGPFYAGFGNRVRHCPSVVGAGQQQPVQQAHRRAVVVAFCGASVSH